MSLYSSSDADIRLRCDLRTVTLWTKVLEGSYLRPCLMNIGAEPAQQSIQTSLAELLIEFGDILIDLFPQLSRDQIAQRNMWRIADHSAGQ